VWVVAFLGVGGFWGGFWEGVCLFLWGFNGGVMGFWGGLGVFWGGCGGFLGCFGVVDQQKRRPQNIARGEAGQKDYVSIPPRIARIGGVQKQMDGHRRTRKEARKSNAVSCETEVNRAIHKTNHTAVRNRQSGVSNGPRCAKEERLLRGRKVREKGNRGS